MHAVTVLVTDETGNPVANALVSFRLPDVGSSGTFNSGLPTEIVTTGQDGRATLSGVQWNSNPGTVALRITAMKDQARAGIMSTQYLSDKVAAAIDPKTSSVNFEVLPAKGTAKQFTAAPVKIEPVPPKSEAAVARSETSPVLSDPAPVTTEALAPKLGDASGEGVFTAGHRGYGKWIIIGAIVAGGAAAGVMLATSKGASSPATVSSTGISIGTPTIIVGHP